MAAQIETASSATDNLWEDKERRRLDDTLHWLIEAHNAKISTLYPSCQTPVQVKSLVHTSVRSMSIKCVEPKHRLKNSTTQGLTLTRLYISVYGEMNCCSTVTWRLQNTTGETLKSFPSQAWCCHCDGVKGN